MNLRLIIAFCFASGFARATPNPLYFSANGSGTMSGVDTNNCQTFGFVETTGSWGSGAGQIPNGTHLICVGQVGPIPILGNNILLSFTPGSGITSPAANPSIYAGFTTGFFLDGTGSSGIVLTGNGSALANQVAATGILITSATSVTISNMPIINIYQHTVPSDTTLSADSSFGVYGTSTGGNNVITGCTFSNVPTGVFLDGPSSVLISNCVFQSCNHDVFAGSTTGASVMIARCFFGSASNWYTSADAYHNDSIIWYGVGTLTSFVLNSCTFNGDMGLNNTAYFFQDGGNAVSSLFANNLFIVHSGNTLNNGCFVGGGVIVNNTFINQGSPLNTAMSISGAYVQVENNLHAGFNTFLSLAGPVKHSMIDHNIYASWASGGNSPWAANSIGYNTFPAWQAGIALETNSMYLNQSAANYDGTIPSNSLALGGGTNLFNLIQTDIAGTARSNSGPWVIGAFTSAAPPIGPARWYAGLHSVPPGTTSSTKTTTNSNVIASAGGATNGSAFPAGEWPFNDGSGSTAADSSGNGDTATLVNSPAWVPGQSTNGFALSFDGASQYVTVANPLASFANFSYSCWIKCGSQTSSTVLASGFIGFAFYSGVPHQLAFVTDGSFYDGAASSAVTDDGNWHCIVGTCSGNSLTIYVDGVQTGAATGGSVRGGGNLFVGWDNGALFGYFPGTVDDVRVYNQALSATNVAALYSAGAQ